MFAQRQPRFPKIWGKYDQKDFLGEILSKIFYFLTAKMRQNTKDQKIILWFRSMPSVRPPSTSYAKALVHGVHGVHTVRFTYGISLSFVYVYRRRLRGCLPNLLTKFNPVRGSIRYFYTSIDVDFAGVPILLTKFNLVRDTYSGAS